ncbi:unnamed protein product, partial [Durusdinium trenchii]
PTDEHEAWVHEEELLPEFLQAWYLLADAGLNAQERNMIQTAIGETYTIQRMSQELRAQWPEDDLQRNQLPQPRASGYWHERKEDSEDDETEEAMTSAAALIANGMNEEGIALMTAAVEAEEEAPRRDQAHHAQEEAPFVCFSDLHEIDEDDGYFTADEGCENCETEYHHGDLQEIENYTTTGEETMTCQQTSWSL